MSQRKRPTTNQIEPRARSKPRAAREMGIGLQALNRLIADGRIQTITVYKRELISEREIERFLDGKA